MATVFISYSRKDAKLARFVTRALERAGHVPWLDEENISAGENLELALEKAVAESDCGVFLIGWDWIESLFTRKEIQLFTLRDKSGGQIPRIGILRAPRDQIAAKLPSELALFTTDEWIDDETDDEVALGRLLRAVAREKPGTLESLKALGKRYAAGDSPEPLALVTQSGGDVSLRTGCEAEMLECGRDSEFNFVEKRYGEKLHHLFLIEGPNWEGHEYFVARIEARLKAEPPHTPVHLRWLGHRPGSAEAYYERLARSPEINCRETELPVRLRQMMATRNLILIHPVIESDYEDESIVARYTEWIPDLLRKAQPAQKLKCIQPVAWEVSKGTAAAMLRWFGATAEDKESEALKLIAAIGDVKKTSEPASLIPARVRLKPITEEQVIAFCDLFELAEGERARLLTLINEKKAERSKEILVVIADFMEKRRRAQRVAS